VAQRRARRALPRHRALETWFEEVEAERRAIDDSARG